MPGDAGSRVHLAEESQQKKQSPVKEKRHLSRSISNFNLNRTRRNAPSHVLAESVPSEAPFTVGIVPSCALQFRSFFLLLHASY